jgi:hypothetical protein
MHEPRDGGVSRPEYHPAMGTGRVGTLFVAAGLVCLGLAIAAGIGGQAVGLGMSAGTMGFGTVLLIAAFGLLGSGCAVLAIGGPDPISGRAVRISLGILGCGLLSTLASAVGAAMSPNDPLESLPLVVLTIGGGSLTLLGIAAVAITLARAWTTRGREDAA